MEKILKNPKTILKLLGVLMVIVGLIFWFSSGKDHCGANGSGTTRASTSIQFGADFYTHSAQYTALAANAAVDTYQLISTAVGLLFVFLGATEICVGFILDGKKEANVTADPDLAPAASPESNETTVSYETPEVSR